MIYPFTILIDSREQTPWLFEGITRMHQGAPYVLEIPINVKGLKTGDYTIEGFENNVCVERKSVGDIIGTITRGRKRFEKELTRMQNMEYSAVVIEGEWKTVLRKCFADTQMNPVSLDSSILAFMMRYPKTHWLFRPGRFAAMKTTFKLFDLYLRRIKRVPFPKISK